MAMYNVTISALHYNYIYRRSVTRFTYIMFSFVLFVGVLIRVSKEGHREESFLKWLHVLTLMDDTVILATSRETLIKNHRCVVIGYTWLSVTFTTGRSVLTSLKLHVEQKVKHLHKCLMFFFATYFTEIKMEKAFKACLLVHYFAQIFSYSCCSE